MQTMGSMIQPATVWTEEAVFHRPRSREADTRNSLSTGSIVRLGLAPESKMFLSREQ